MTHRKDWEEFAAEVGGQCRFVEQRGDFRQQTLTTYWGEWTVTLEERETLPSMSPSSVTTKAHAEFSAIDDLHLSATRQAVIAKALFLVVLMGSLLGGGIILFLAMGLQGASAEQTMNFSLLVLLLVLVVLFLAWTIMPLGLRGDYALRRLARVTGSNDDKVTLFFASKRLRQSLRNQPEGSCLEIVPPQDRSDAYLGSLRFVLSKGAFTWYGVPRSPGANFDELWAMYELMGESLDRLVAIGSASPKAPEVKRPELEAAACRILADRHD